MDESTNSTVDFAFHLEFQGFLYYVAAVDECKI